MQGIEQLIPTAVISIVIAITGWIIKHFITSAITQNKDQFDSALRQHIDDNATEQSESLSVLRNIDSNIKELTSQITSLKIELAEKYVKKDDLEIYKRENIEAHKELREEIRDLEKRLIN